jgi:type IV pilus assembly protein PilM
MVFGKKHVVGLDIGSSAVKAVELTSQKGNYKVVSLGVEALPPETIVDGAIISKLPVADAINKIYSEQKIINKKVATSISGNSIIVKKIMVPPQGEEDLTESVRWEAEQYIPFDAADVNIDYQMLGDAPSGENVNVLLVAAKKEKIADQTSVIVLAGKMPVIVDVDAFALQNAYEVNYEPTPHSIVALLNIGASMININVVKGQDSLFTRDISMGGNQYTDFLQREFNISYEDAEKLKRGIAIPSIAEQSVKNIINSVSELIALEIEKTLDFFKTTTTTNKIDRILVSGGSSQIPGLIEFLADKFETPAERFDSFKKVSYDTRKYDSEFMNEISSSVAIALGLALRTAEDSQ